MPDKLSVVGHSNLCWVCSLVPCSDCSKSSFAVCIHIYTITDCMCIGSSCILYRQIG